MQFYCFHIQLFVLFCLSVIAAHAIPLSSAKVAVLKGGAYYGSHGEENEPITEGTILKEGDSIVTNDLGVVYLIFSNGVGLTVQQNSNLVFSKLDQRAFWRNDTDEIPEEEISKSSFVLELKYGSVKGHVEGLRKDSEFRIKTMLGDVLVSDNLFFVELLYDSFYGKYSLNVQNVNGVLDLITKFSGPVKFGRKGSINKSYDPNAEVFQIVRIPPRRSISMKAPRSIAEFGDSYKRFPKSSKSRLFEEFETIIPFVADQEVSVVSPNGTEGIADSNMVLEKPVSEPAAQETLPEPVIEDIVPESVVEETELKIQ